MFGEIAGATAQVSMEGEDIGMAARAGVAAHGLASPALERPGRRNLVFTIAAAQDRDRLLLAVAIGLAAAPRPLPPHGIVDPRRVASVQHRARAWAGVERGRSPWRR